MTQKLNYHECKVVHQVRQNQLVIRKKQETKNINIS